MMTAEELAEFLDTLNNPRHAHPNENGSIALDAVFKGQRVTFWASPTDIAEYGKEVYDKAVSGHYGKIGSYIEEKLPHEEEAEARLKRIHQEQQEFFEKQKADMIAEVLKSTNAAPQKKGGF
jgi:hypothetical protein